LFLRQLVLKSVGLICIRMTVTFIKMSYVTRSFHSTKSSVRTSTLRYHTVVLCVLVALATPA